MANPEQQLASDIGDFYDDLHGFIMYVFPWGLKDGPLENQDGPDTWQVDIANEISESVKKEGIQAALRVAVSSGHGIGKSVRLTQIIEKAIVSPNNEVITMMKCKWGDLKEGDYVLGSDGSPTKIVATKNWNTEMYRVTFDDGSSVDVGAQHEWNVRGRQERRKKIDGWRTLETQEIIDIGVLRPNGKVMTKQWEIPVQGIAKFKERDVYDPYTIGVWLGDGCSLSGVIGSTRQELWDKMGLSPNKDTMTYKKNGIMLMTPTGMTSHLKKTGMMPITCDTKFIHDDYKYNCEEVRRELVSGMLDTDGEVHKSGSMGYSSTSKQLVEDLIWMVRSLGGKAQMQPTAKKAGYKKDGEYHPCKDCYRCTINFGGKWNPFTHTYKKAKLAEFKDVQHRYLCRWIESIEPLGVHESMCIQVEAENHLYLVNDFIVTHNSALVAWIIIWFVSTRPNPQAVVTANTQNQLTNKTWRELAKWHRMAVNSSWFQWTATKFYLKEAPETWYASAIPWSEKNSEAFAGTHEEHVLMIFDESSAIADSIWEVCEGAMTTPGAMWVCFGNPTKNTGRFYQCFNKFSHRWITRHIDSRTAKMANRAQLDEWVNDYGEDSDFVRVRVRGVFPRAGSCQLISSEVVDAARKYKAEGYENDSLVFGCDVARFGDNKSIIVKRRGRKVIQTMKWLGISTMEFAAFIAKEISLDAPDAVFVDGAGVGGGVIDRLDQLGFNVIEVQAAGSPEDLDRFTNKRMECWHRMNEWLKKGAEIPDDNQLCDGLIGPEYFFSGQNKMQLEKKEDMKKRGLDSPDEADGLALTFAERVLSFAKTSRSRNSRNRNWRVV